MVTVRVNISLETRGGGGADVSADNVQNLAEKQSLGGKCEVFVDNLSAKDIISWNTIKPERGLFIL